jgi:ADP-ribose pyrophosphatase YjhB (NUDIX family)
MTEWAVPLFSTGLDEAPSRIKLGVAVLIRDHRGWVLLEKRSDCGLWGVPGGRIEPGESVETAALREILEETGLVIKIEKLIGVYSDPQQHRIIRYPEAIVHSIDVVVEARAVSGTVQISLESEALEYFSPGDFPSNLVPSSWAILIDAKERISGQVR